MFFWLAVCCSGQNIWLVNPKSPVQICPDTSFFFCLLVPYCKKRPQFKHFLVKSHKEEPLYISHVPIGKENKLWSLKVTFRWITGWKKTNYFSHWMKVDIFVLVLKALNLYMYVFMNKHCIEAMISNSNNNIFVQIR